MRNLRWLHPYSGATGNLLVALLFGASAGLVDYCVAVWTGAIHPFKPFMSYSLVAGLGEAVLALPVAVVLFTVLAALQLAIRRVGFRHFAALPDPYVIFAATTILLLTVRRSFFEAHPEATVAVTIGVLASVLGGCLVCFLLRLLMRRRFSYLPWGAAMLVSLLLFAHRTLPDGAPNRSGTGGASGKPNVVFVIADALRYDHVGCSNRHPIKTPNLDALARDAVVFRNAISQGTETTTSMRSIFTSLYPLQHSTERLGERLSRKAATLAGVLAENGYFSCCIMANAGNIGSLGWGFQTFDEFFLSNLEYDLRIYYDHTLLAALIDRKTTRVSLPAEQTAAKTRRFLQSNRDDPFFLYVHIMEPHEPVLAPAQFVAMYPEDRYTPVLHQGFNNDIMKNPEAPSLSIVRRRHSLYDANVSYMDAAVGEMVGELKRRGLYDSSLIIFTADHGESLYDHNYQYSHSRYLYDELIHVPLIMKFPGDQYAGTAVEALVRHIDLYPTIMEVLGLQYDYPYPLEGESFYAVAQGRKREHAEYAFSSISHTGPDNMLHSVRDSRWHFIHRPATGTIELYDLELDPQEARNLANDNAQKEVLDHLMGVYQKWLAHQALILKPEQAAVNELDVQRLRSLGYIQ